MSKSKTVLDSYEKFGFSCVHIPAGSIDERVKFILGHTDDETA